MARAYPSWYTNTLCGCPSALFLSAFLVKVLKRFDAIAISVNEQHPRWEFLWDADVPVKVDAVLLLGLCNINGSTRDVLSSVSGKGFRVNLREEVSKHAPFTLHEDYIEQAMLYFPSSTEQARVFRAIALKFPRSDLDSLGSEFVDARFNVSVHLKGYTSTRPIGDTRAVRGDPTVRYVKVQPAFVPDKEDTTQTLWKLVINEVDDV